MSEPPEPKTTGQPEPPMTFGYPGDGGLGDRLIAAVLAGKKTATSSLAVEYQNGEPLPRPGQTQRLADHGGTVHGRVRTTAVRIVPMHLVGDDVAHAEGEGYADADAWRVGHREFWLEVAGLVRVDAGDPDWQLREAEPVVVEFFELLPCGSR